MTSPSLDDLCESLSSVSGIRPIDPDEPLGDYGVDSLAFMSWLQVLEDEFGYAEDVIMDRTDELGYGLDTVTVRVIWTAGDGRG
jgi:aryl carrier-like protein